MLRKLFGSRIRSRDQARPRHRSPRRVREVEQLEPRVVLSFSAAFNGALGDLVIKGTDFSEAASLSVDPRGHLKMNGGEISGRYFDPDLGLHGLYIAYGWVDVSAVTSITVDGRGS